MSTIADQSFATLLRAHRRNAGLTQRALAELAQVGLRTIINLEQGLAHPHKTTLILLADALQLSMHDRQTLEAAITGASPDAAHAHPESSVRTLPHLLTRLIGREQEQHALVHLILHDHCRLVTLTGLAGIGKTRLAVGVAEQLFPAFPDGVVFVLLASLRDPQLIPLVVAQMLGIQEEPERSPQDLITAHLQNKRMLLVLDNFEHLLDGASLIVNLLTACPALVVLVTSRTALRIRGEQRFPVPPLVYAATVSLTSTESCAAEDLFIERAREVQPLLPLTPENVASIAAICRRLNGIPLAIELAAMRIALFSPPELERQLDRCLPLLKQGSRDLPQRQQTMRDAITWSYDLLSPCEQAVFRHLAVCVGGWTMSTALALCSTDTAEEDLLVILSSLGEASLIQRGTEETTGEPRFTMLEVLREYGLEQLAQHEELLDMQRRHAVYVLTLAQLAEPAFRGPEQVRWLERLDQEQGNVRAALQWAKEYDAALGLSIAIAIWRYWYLRSYLSEGRSWLETFASRTYGPPEMQRARARANIEAATFATEQGDLKQAELLIEEGLRYYQETDDHIGMMSALGHLGDLAFRRDLYEIAEGYYCQSLELGRPLVGKEHMIASGLNNLAITVKAQGRYDEAQLLLEESLNYRRELGDHYGMANSLINFSNLLCHQGAFERAAAVAEEGLLHARQSGNRRIIADALDYLGKALTEQGAYQRALWVLEESNQIYQELEDRLGVESVLRHLGDLACAQSEWQVAKAYYAACIEVCQQEDRSVGIAKCLAGWARALLTQGDIEQAIYFIYTAATTLSEGGISSRSNIARRLDQMRCAIQETIGEIAFQRIWEESKTPSLALILQQLGS